MLFSLTVATLFSLFWIISALLVLSATLFVSISTGITIWAWAAAGITVARWAYNKFLAADRELSQKISGQTSNKEDNTGKQENFGQVNGEVYNSQLQNEFGSDKKMPKRDEYVLDKKAPKRNDYGIVLERKIVNEV